MSRWAGYSAQSQRRNVQILQTPRQAYHCPLRLAVLQGASIRNWPGKSAQTSCSPGGSRTKGNVYRRLLYLYE